MGAAAFQRQVVSEGNRATARLVAAEAASVREVRPGLSKQLSLVAYRLDPDTGTPSVLDGELQSGAKWVNLGLILPGVEPGGRLESAAKWNALSRTESASRPLPRSTTRSGRGCATRCRRTVERLRPSPPGPSGLKPLLVSYGDTNVPSDGDIPGGQRQCSSHQERAYERKPRSDERDRGSNLRPMSMRHWLLATPGRQPSLTVNAEE